MQKEVTIPFGKSGFPALEIINGDTLPSIIIIHEIWGLTHHIQDVCHRFAGEGFNVIAPDLFFNVDIFKDVKPGLFERVNDEETRDDAQKELREILTPINSKEFADMTRKKLKAVFDYLKDRSKGKIAVLGFCFGGTYSFQFAVDEEELSGCVVFYGHAPGPISQVANIPCPVLAFYGEEDLNLVKALPGIKLSMEEYKKKFDFIVYPNTGHAFFNNENVRMYREGPAKDAWVRSIKYLNMQLR